MDGKKHEKEKKKSHKKSGHEETASTTGSSNPYKHSEDVKDEKADLDDEDNKYHGSYLKKKLFRGMADLNMTITPDNEKKLLVLAGGFAVFGIIAWCFCKCLKKPKK